MEDDTVRTQATANTSKQFVQSPDLSDAVTHAVLSSNEAHTKMMDLFFASEERKNEFIKVLGQLVYENINRVG